MVKKNGTKVNKTAKIREYLVQDPGMSPSLIAQRLNKQGVKVSAAYVSTIKSNLKQREGLGKTTPGELSLEDLVETKRLVERLGGLDRARKLLEALSKLN